jgi:hypothetical protein
MRYGAGGSGEPLTRDVVQSSRFSMPAAFRNGGSLVEGVGVSESEGKFIAPNATRKAAETPRTVRMG